MSLSQPKPSLLGLPDEILVHILSYLSLKSDVYNTALTCARLQEVAVDRRILRRLDVRRDPKFSKKALSFFTEPNISDKIQDVDIKCVSWIKPWELMKKLPSLTKFSFSVHRRCTHGVCTEHVIMSFLYIFLFCRTMSLVWRTRSIWNLSLDPENS